MDTHRPDESDGNLNESRRYRVTGVSIRHYRDYRERDGVVVPAEGEVGWYIDDEWRAVWKGVVVAYDASPEHP
jgi:hypothetical protein